MSEQTDTTTTGTTGTTGTTQDDPAQATRPTKSFYQLRARKIFQVPSVPTAAQAKGDHLQVRFGDRYVSRTMGWDEMSKLDWAGYKLLYEQAKVAGATAPSYSGSGEQYVPLTVTPDVANGGQSGTLSLNGIVMLTFELDPDVNLDPPVKPSGVYSAGHPDTGDGDGEDGDDDGDEDEDDEDEDDTDGDGDDD